MVLVLDLVAASDRSPEWHSWKSPKKTGAEDHEIASSLGASHPTQRNAALDDLLDLPKPAVATVLPISVKIA